MGVTLYIFLAIIIIVIGITLLRSEADKDLYKKKPLLFSIMALGLVVLNWILLLSDIYDVLSEKIGDIVFQTIWFSICIIGIVSSLKEFKNNIFIALLTGVLTTISLMMGGVLFLIGCM